MPDNFLLTIIAGCAIASTYMLVNIHGVLVDILQSVRADTSRE